ncbi:response regulator [Patescibacteria group bacterium]|nr:response regulator [Patescibacteria group bacterium]
MATSKKAKIVVVDNDGTYYGLLTPYLNSKSLLIKARGFKDALSIIKNQKPDLVITDLILQESNGFELIKSVRDSNNTKTKFIIISSYNSPELVNNKDFLNSMGVWKYLIQSCCTPQIIAKEVLKAIR